MRIRVAVITALVAAVSVGVLYFLRVAIVRTEPELMVAQTVYLSDLSWQNATSGWLAVANDGVPTRDIAFYGGPMKLADVTYDKGIGTYPVSEITYMLDSGYSSFLCDVGLDDEVAAGTGGAEFLVFVDDVLVFRSDIVRGGEPAKNINIPLANAHQLRLVVADASEGALHNYADWADARLIRPLLGGSGEDVSEGPSSRRDALAQTLKEARATDALSAESLAKQEILSLQSSNGYGNSAQSAAFFDEQAGRLWLYNNYLGISLGYGRDSHGQLTVVYLPTQTVVVNRATPAIKFGGGTSQPVNLNSATHPQNFKFVDANDPALGSGKRVEATYLTSAGDEQITVELTLYDASPYFVFQINAERPSEASEPVQFQFFSFDGDSFNLGEEVEYLTDYSRLRHMHVDDNGIALKDALGLGKPLLAWGSTRPEAMLLAILDETRGPAVLRAKLDPGRVMGRLSLDVGQARGRGPSSQTSSPRLYFEVARQGPGQSPFENFKRVMGQTYPPAPLPSWVKYQWLSWYVYYMDINEEFIRRQIDYIADNLADLGSWNVLVDAGWYLSEGKPGGDWRNVDSQKFPSGLRALVDYAHAKNVKVVLYFSAPYLDSRQQAGDWLGLRGIIDAHPEWLRLLGQDDSRQSYVYNFSSPGFREYLQGVLTDFFVKYDVDGIKIDGLGNADGAIVNKRRLDSFGLVGLLDTQTMDIYRFIYDTATSLKKDVYVESGWQTPVFAHPFAHTFRYGDERDAFSNSYPAPGLVEHIDYAILQKMALGQRSNMGALTGDPNQSQVNKWWLEAGLALGTQLAMSFDLPLMSDETLSEYRALLMHYNAFSGSTQYVGSPFPESFATTLDGTTYLGVLNRGADEKSAPLRLSDYGLSTEGQYSVYDVSRKRFTRSQGRIRAQMPGESFRLFIIRNQPGVMWTNSSVHDLQRDESSLSLTVKGPPSIQGFINLYTPEPDTVTFDDRLLKRSFTEDVTVDLAEQTYWYDTRTDILTIRYSHDGGHEIKVEY